MTEPCKACLPGCCNHKRQLIVVRDGVRKQVCELCHTTLGFLPPLSESETAALIVETLREIDSTNGTEPSNDPGYSPALVAEKLRKAWRAR